MEAAPEMIPADQRPTAEGAAVAATMPTVRTSADGKALMDVILYGNQAGWDSASAARGGSSSPVLMGSKRLLREVIDARRFQKNDNDHVVAAPLQVEPGNAASSNSDGGESSHKEQQQQQATIAALGIDDEILREVLAEAKKTSDTAERSLANGLINCENWMGLRDAFYHAGALFSLAGLPDDAARCLLQATYINRAFKDDDEALASLAQSVHNIKLAHPGVAVGSLVRLAACYERNSLLFQAARCLKDAAEICDSRLDIKESAITHYTSAIAMYRRTQNPYKVENTLVQACHERLCFLHVALGHFEVAEQLFLEKARMTPRNLPATRFYMYATLCVLARGRDNEDAYFDSIYDTKKVFNSLQEVDREFQKGKENDLLRALLQAMDENSLNHFDQAVQRYSAYKTTVPDPAFDAIVDRCRQNFYDHLERFA